MKRRQIDVTAKTSGTPAAVFALLADRTTWPAWSPIDSVELERAGSPEAEGVGSIRVNHKGRTVGRDEIVELVPGERFVYRSLSGVPVRDYVGEVTLEQTNDGGTAIRWHTSFFAKTPGTGWMVERALKKFLKDCVDGLATAASTQPAH